MKKAPLLRLLARLEKHYGAQEPCWPVDPYEFLVWWHCGYPASDAACAKGWEKLVQEVGVSPQQLLDASPGKLGAALRAGGMVPELRAVRLKEIAMRVKDQFGGDLRGALSGSIAEVRRILKRFPGIGDPGADRILLFAGLSPVAAVPSNTAHVLPRIRRGVERESYIANYRDGQQATEDEVPREFSARQRAYLLVKRHGQETCKRTKPRCEACAIRENCAYFARRAPGNRGSSRFF